jgi:hypothetical protein
VKHMNLELEDRAPGATQVPHIVSRLSSATILCHFCEEFRNGKMALQLGTDSFLMGGMQVIYDLLIDVAKVRASRSGKMSLRHPEAYVWPFG